MEDMWKRPNSFAEEAAKKSDHHQFTTSAKISSDPARSPPMPSKIADEIKTAALKQADQIKEREIDRSHSLIVGDSEEATAIVIDIGSKIPRAAECPPSQAKQTQHISDVLRIDNLLNNTSEWLNLYRKPHETQLELSTPLVVAGVLCFIAASISSAGGIGGGGLFIPILTLVAHLDLRTASSLSAFMVTGGSVANVMYNLCIKGSTKFGGKSLIDYDIALL
ncbi:hypothetical protein ACLB2K_024745 [Fragaria x ananassa]